MKKTHLALLFVAGCAFEPPEGQRIEPPAEYRAIYDSAQACTGRRGNFDRLTWILVPDRWPCQNGGWCVGHYDNGTIWLAEGYRDYPPLVLHELIHSLGIDGHPYHPFEEPCHALYPSRKGWD